MRGRKTVNRQYEVMAAIRTFIKAYDFAPSMRDLMASTGIKSTHYIRTCLLRLEQEGLIRRQDNLARSIEIVGAKKTGKRLSTKILDQRKFNSEETRNKKADAGKGNKPLTAYGAKVSMTRAQKESADLEAAVQFGLANNEKMAADQDVIRHNRLPLSYRVRATKIG